MDADRDTDFYGHINGHGDAQLDRYEYADSNGYTERDRDVNPDIHGKLNCHSFSYGYVDIYTVEYANRDRDEDANLVIYTDLDSDPDADGDGN